MSIDISGRDPVEVVGESFYRMALRDVAGTGPGESRRSHLASLVREPANPYDRNAVEVTIDGKQVGHLPRELAALVADPLDELGRTHGEVLATAEIRGADSELGFGVVLHLDLEKLDIQIADHQGDLSLSPGVEIPDLTDALVASTPSDKSTGIADEEIDRRRPTIERAVERWKTELIDLTGRNRLLYMRDLRTGTLSFDSSARNALMQLVGGKRVALSKIVPRSKLPENPAAKLSPFEDAVRRMRAIARTARSYEEERGVRTLFLACGVATWRNDRAARPPAAPVLLVPLAIRARGASQQDFELSLAGDLEVNPTLLHMLKVEFNLEVNDGDLYEHSEMDGVIDTPEELRLAFNWMSEKCASVPGWAIADQFVLGNFWYAKLPMVKDLERSIDALASHDVASAFAGDAEARSAVIGRQDAAKVTATDVDQLAPGDEFNVLDSDSSQSLAIARALSGEDLVLKGPPGTGKSQTIANLICNAIGEGKRVLFVAEKRAAIEAVTKRLNGAGLGNLVLDLHRGAESRKWLAGQLGESLAAVRSTEAVARDAEEGRLTRARKALHDHSQALHVPHPPWGLSVFNAQMEVLRRGRPQVNARLRGPDLEAVNDGRLGELDEALRDLLALDGLSLVARKSPWAGAEVKTVEASREAEDLVIRLKLLVEKVQIELPKAAQEGGIRPPDDSDQAAEAMALWGLIEACSRTFDLAILEGDLGQTVAALGPLQGSALPRLVASMTSSEYRASLAFGREHLVNDQTLDPRDLYAGLVDCQQLQDHWQAQRVVDGTPAGLPDGVPNLRGDLAELRELVGKLDRIIHRDFAGLPFEEMQASLVALESEMETVRAMPRIYAAREKFADAGLSGFIAELDADQELLSEAREELRRLWWQSATDHLSMLPAADGLVAFQGDLHGQVADEFRELDREHVQAAALRVKRIAAEAAVAAQDRYPEQAQLVKGQAKRKRGHMPVRELFSQAPDVLTALRPCWVMSPLMVSQLIPSERSYFDLVVFDEASQVKPVEALTSMIRGSQLVVAGDERQLPPTAFFDAAAASDGDEGEQEESTELADFESLLDVLMTLFEMEMLRWHYRSRDERLIGFSNREIYGGDLTTFPGVVDGDVLRHVWVDEPASEDESRVSPDAEVRQVVDLVIEHARQRPDESLGVIALGSAHADAIDAGLLAEMPKHPDLESFFAEDREERFFVKNLERVQGDERDAVVLAIGYGKAPDGTLPHRFGPLNNAGGERRLNVAVTRAKRRMTVVSSFQADDIDPKRSSADGVKLLRAFLAYAASGGDVSEDSGGKLDATALHEQIASALVGSGYEAAVLHGTSEDRIDVVVVNSDSDLPEVAVEIDGVAYARRPSVRDRDRLRSEQLRRLGWGHVSTWSQDWYRDPPAAARDLLAGVTASFEELRAERDGSFSAYDEPAVESDEDGSDEEGVAVAPPRDRGPRPTLSSGGPAITDWRQGDLLKLAEWIESDGLLRTGDELKDELMREIGIARRGSRVVRVLDQVIAARRTR